MWGLKKKVDSLEAFMLDRFNSLEDGLKIVVARGEVVEILKTEIELLREERKQMLDRLMARDFETLQTFTLPHDVEELAKAVAPEEDEGLAGEIVALD